MTCFSTQPELAPKLGDYAGRLSRLLGITEIDLHIEEVTDPDTGEQKGVIDLAWPSGIQEELSQPVAVLLNETTETLARASQAGFRCFTAIPDFQRYVQTEVLVEA